MDRSHSIVSGTVSLRLNSAEYNEYAVRHEMLAVEFYRRERAEKGIWASNQGKYVKSLDQFNPWDNRNMEKLYEKYYGDGRQPLDREEVMRECLLKLDEAGGLGHQKHAMILNALGTPNGEMCSNARRCLAAGRCVRDPVCSE